MVLCPWDFPGKNTSVGCHLPLPGEVRAPAITYIRDEPSSFVVPTLVLDFRLIHLSPHWTPSLDCPTTNSTGAHLYSLRPLPSKSNSCSFRMPLRNQLPVFSRREGTAGASLVFSPPPPPCVFTLEFLLDLGSALFKISQTFLQLSIVLHSWRC